MTPNSAGGGEGSDVHLLAGTAHAGGHECMNARLDYMNT